MEPGRSVRAGILVLILLLALALRLWGIGFGLPHQYHPDEAHEVYRALQLGAGSFNFDRIAKGGYFYLLSLEYGVYYLALRVTGAVASPEDFAVTFIQDPSALWLMGRVTTAALGTLTVFLVYLLGAASYGPVAGLLAAVLLAVNPLHVEDSHYITVNVPVTLLVVACLLFLLDLARSGRCRSYLFSGLFFGLALQTKLSAAAVVVPFALAHLIQTRKAGGRFSASLFNRKLLCALLCAAGIYILGTPGILFKAGAVIDSTLSIFTSSPTEFIETSFSSPAEALAMRRSPWSGYAEDLLASLGWPALVAALIGVLYAVFRRTEADWLLASLCLLYYPLIASAKTLRAPSYLTLMLPGLLLLAGRFIAETITWIPARRTASTMLVAVTVFLCLSPALASVRFDSRIARKDTRTLAKEWIETHVPEGSKILLDAGRFQSHEAPSLQESRENLEVKIRELADGEQGKALFLTLKKDHLEGKTYDLTSTNWGSEVETLDYYKRSGYRYIIVSDSISRLYRTPLAEKMFPKSVAFYGALKADPDLVLRQRFEASPDRPGPSISIYEIRPR